MNSACKSQHLKLYLRLKQEECLIEKSVETFIINSTVDTEVWRNIKRDIDKFEHERQKLIDSLRGTVIEIYQELKSVKNIIKVDDIKKIDLETFKTKLQKLWKRIEDFKNTCNNTNNLIGEQNILDSDLNLLMRIIRKHKDFSIASNSHCKISNSKPQLQKEDSLRDCNYDDVEDFCTLLAKTGHSGNWNEEDHLLFLKLRKKHKSIPSLITAIQSKCPDLTKESIINHESWYKTYLELRDKQRIAVQEWRKRKENERIANRKIEENSVKNTVKKSENSNNNNRLLKFPNHKKDDIEKKKEMLRQWREKKDKIKAAEEERLKNRIRARREFKENRRQARNAKLKKIVKEYKEKKSLEKKENENNGNDKSSLMSALILRFYRAKDQEFLEKRRNILLSKMNDFKQNLQPIQPIFSHIRESTLFKETKSWQDKLKTTEPKTTPTVSYIKDLPRRAIASWQNFETPEVFSFQQR